VVISHAQIFNLVKPKIYGGKNNELLRRIRFNIKGDAARAGIYCEKQQSNAGDTSATGSLEFEGAGNRQIPRITR
jgi:hypothetical protein